MKRSLSKGSIKRRAFPSKHSSSGKIKLTLQTPKTSNQHKSESKIRPSSTRHRRHQSDTGASKAHLTKAEKQPLSKKYAYMMPKAPKFPLSPSTALRHFSNRLSAYERKEIQEFKEIYFIGKQHKRQSECNHGFDNEKGEYLFAVGEQIAYRYEILAELGSGSFGTVLKVLDHKSKQHFALKVIRNKTRFHKQAAIEVKILKFLKAKDVQNNFPVVHISRYFVFRRHVCILFELLGSSLYEFLRKNDGLSLSLVRHFAMQMLKTLRIQELCKIIHCDFKPENILLEPNKSLALKVIDYGSSCFEAERVYTYIQSRFYRAPEVILGADYSTKIDVWSFGCLLVELYTGYPLFAGENETEQLMCIMEVIGLPPATLIQRSSRKDLFFNGNDPIEYINRRGRKRIPGSKDLKHVLKAADSSFISLVSACLEWEPSKRISAKDALLHPWIATNASENKYRLIKRKSLHMTENSTTHSYKPSLDEKHLQYILSDSFIS